MEHESTLASERCSCGASRGSAAHGASVREPDSTSSQEGAPPGVLQAARRVLQLRSAHLAQRSAIADALCLLSGYRCVERQRSSADLGRSFVTVQRTRSRAFLRLRGRGTGDASSVDGFDASLIAKCRSGILVVALKACVAMSNTSPSLHCP